MQHETNLGAPSSVFEGGAFCNPNLSNSQRFNALPPHSNANKKVIDTQCTSMLFSRVFATRKSWPALLAPLPFLPSSHSSLFFSEVCTLFFVTAASQPFVYQSLRHSFIATGGHILQAKNSEPSLPLALLHSPSLSGEDLRPFVRV